ncbi:MAG: glycosyltransferase family 9 protein [Deltaproteobacteria bacterium]|nr:glycosyltransferase family 9 protein [Deltaproteobacteria bacterium]
MRRIAVIPPDEIQSILFLRHDRIGDMVLSTAALKALRKGYPQAKITVLASDRNFEILKHNLNVDEVLIYKGLSWFIREIRPREYDLVIDPFVTHELKQALLTYLSGGKYRIGFDKAGREVFFNVRGPIAFEPKSMVDHLLDLAELAGGKRKGCGPEVFLNDTEIAWAAEALAQGRRSTNGFIVALHPGAYHPSQRWPVQRFGELVQQLLAHYEARVIVLGSHDEEALLHDMQNIAGDRVQFFFGLKLRELMALISHCDLLVCNNSGPLHIASAIRVPTVSMIGPTVTPLWLPYGQHNAVIGKALSCSPCNRAICKDHECMESITVDEVFEAVKRQIAGMGLKHRLPSTPHKPDRKPKKSWKGERK